MGSQPTYEDLQAALRNECERVKQIRAEFRAAGFSWSDDKKAFVYDPDPCRDCGNAQGATLKDVLADRINQTARAEQLADRVCKMDREMVETRTRAHDAEEALTAARGENTRLRAAVESFARDCEQGVVEEAAKMKAARKRGDDSSAHFHGGVQDAERYTAKRLREMLAPASDNAALRPPAVGPAQDGAGADLPRSGIPLIDHDYVPTPHPAVDACDKRVSDDPDGPSRQCGRPRREHRDPAVQPGKET